MTPARRTQRPALTRSPGYRLVVPVLLVGVALVTVVVLILAGGVLFGLIP